MHFEKLNVSNDFPENSFYPRLRMNFEQLNVFNKNWTFVIQIERVWYKFNVFNQSFYSKLDVFNWRLKVFLKAERFINDERNSLFKIILNWSFSSLFTYRYETTEEIPPCQPNQSGLSELRSNSRQSLYKSISE